jgi:hypothetical protein
MKVDWTGSESLLMEDFEYGVLKFRIILPGDFIILY